MKMLLVGAVTLTLSLALAMPAAAQIKPRPPSDGTLNFANGARGLSAPVTNAMGARISGGPYVVDLYYTTNTSAVPNPEGADTLQPAGFNGHFLSHAQAEGYFAAGAKTLRGVMGGTVILAQLRVWNTNGGATSYDLARKSGAERGFSKPFLVRLGEAPGMPPSLIGLQGFQLLSGRPSAP